MDKEHYVFFFLNKKIHIYAKKFKLWEILQKIGIPDHLTCLLRNLYAVQEAIVRTGHGKTDWFQIGKGVHQGPAYLTYMQSIS